MVNDEVWAIWDGEELSIPYPGSLPVGSREAAEHHAAPNRHNGWKVVPLSVQVDQNECPHDWERAGFSVNWGQIHECRICGDKTP